MRSRSLTSVLLLLASSAVTVLGDKPVSYDGYKVFCIKTHGHTSAIREQLEPLSLDEWSHEIDHVDVAVSPEQLAAFEALSLETHVMHDNLGSSIATESSSTTKWKRQADDPSWFDSYHDYEDHIQYFTDIQATYPNNTEAISSGYSYQNRSIYGLHLWGADGPGKPAVLYHGTVHAREWIAAPVVEYITLQLLQGYEIGDEDIQKLLNKYDFYVFPFVNPDGFVYTQTTNRLWRKNRQPAPPPPANQSCFGRDINRNWEFAWDANPNGASTNPCSEIYKGLAPSDTPENAGLDKFVRQLRDSVGIKLFIDWHSYGQYILSPYGYRNDLYAPELGKWEQASSLVSEAIRDSSERRTTFTFGPSGATLYTTTGAAPDHVYSIGGADFSYTIELPDTGDYGFILPPEKIRPTVEELWAGQQVLLSILDADFSDDSVK
ncbi:hypothetical protein SCAR479_04818 [Seiridium cardinale]|uniref:Peptidase M14 domain-containing protein n=1 Tax=Seiridium cardinale TaxID=138064 RepID=A0ABR2XXC7_9PEZI